MILKRKKGVTLFLKFKQKRQLLLLDPHAAPQEKLLKSNDKLVIILSPALYWVKKLSLPVKYLREAKRLLPSLFEESIADGHYSYSVYKKGDEYLAFAYEDSRILELLKRYGIEPSRIASIHFAQTFFDGLQGSFSCNDDEVLSVVDGVVILTPKKWAKDVKPLDLTHLQVPKEHITLKQFGHIVDNKTLYRIGSVVLLFMLILVVQLVSLDHKVQEWESKNDGVFSKYKLEPTMMQNRAILAQYKKRYKEQIALREAIAQLLELPLEKGVSIKSMTYKNKKLICVIKGADSAYAKRIESILHKKKLSGLRCIYE